jgi:DNA-binding response OmpR family regulator
VRPRVFIFEDNDIIRSALEHILQKQGYEVFTFSDPLMCQAFAFDHDCAEENACADIIISDINMPQKTGMELFKERRQKGCKVKYWALMSADWRESDLKDAQRLGCHIFYKPFSMEEMLRWVDDCTKKLDQERKLSDLPKKPD